MKNILIVSQELPFPLKTGGQVSIYARGLGLSKNNRVDLCSVNLENLDYSQNDIKNHLSFFNQINIFPREIPSLFQKGRFLISILYFIQNIIFQKIPRGAQVAINKEVSNFLKKNHQKYDLILFENYNTFIQFLKNKPLFNKSKIALITHNLENKLAYENFKLAKNFFLKGILYFEYKKILSYEKKIYNLSPLTYCISKEDFNILKRDYDGNFQYIPQHIRPTSYKWKFTRSKKVIFNGNLNFSPNLDGLLWYLNEVHPQVLDLEPNYSLIITGNSNFKNLIEKYSNVKMTGFLSSDVFFKEFISADVMINPVRTGAGVKIKILDGISIGIPIVATRHSAAGIDDSLDLFSDDNPEEFAKFILMGFRDDLKSKQLIVDDYNNICNKILVEGKNG